MNEEFYERLPVNYKICPGMTTYEVEKSMGKPSSVNRTVTNNVIHEQWCYHLGNCEYYLYFDNGILCVFQ